MTYNTLQWGTIINRKNVARTKFPATVVISQCFSHLPDNDDLGRAKKIAKFSTMKNYLQSLRKMTMKHILYNN